MALCNTSGASRLHLVLNGWRLIMLAATSQLQVYYVCILMYSGVHSGVFWCILVCILVYYVCKLQLHSVAETKQAKVSEVRSFAYWFAQITN